MSQCELFFTLFLTSYRLYFTRQLRNHTPVAEEGAAAILARAAPHAETCAETRAKRGQRATATKGPF